MAHRVVSVKLMMAAAIAAALACWSAALDAAERTIVVIERSPENGTNHVENGNNLPAGATAVEVTSVADAVTKVTAQLGADDCIKNLHFRGHASAGNQGVGDGVNTKDGKHINGDADGSKPWKAELKKLKFCADATIHLWGCNVGSCDLGASKLKEIADELKVKVRGAVNTVGAGAQESYTGPIQEASPDKPKPEHKAAAKEKAKPKPQQKCDINFDGDIDVTDINLIFAARNTSVATEDRRDADGDGLITVNDARVCTLLCTNRLCAK